MITNFDKLLLYYQRAKENLLRELIDFINSTLGLTAVPVNILSEKRWASDDTLFKQEPLEGMPQRVQLSEKRGVIIYDWDEISDETVQKIQDKWVELGCE